MAPIHVVGLCSTAVQNLKLREAKHPCASSRLFACQSAHLDCWMSRCFLTAGCYLAGCYYCCCLVAADSAAAATVIFWLPVPAGLWLQAFTVGAVIAVAVAAAAAATAAAHAAAVHHSRFMLGSLYHAIVDSTVASGSSGAGRLCKACAKVIACSSRTMPRGCWRLWRCAKPANQSDIRIRCQ